LFRGKNKKIVSVLLTSIITLSMLTVNISAMDIDNMSNEQIEEYIKSFENMTPEEIEGYFKKNPDEVDNLKKAREKLGLSTDLMIIYGENKGNKAIEVSNNGSENKAVEIENESIDNKNINLIGEVDNEIGEINLSWLEKKGANKYIVYRILDSENKHQKLSETQFTNYKDYISDSVSPNKPDYIKKNIDNKTGLLFESSDVGVSTKYCVEAVNKKGESIGMSDQKEFEIISEVKGYCYEFTNEKEPSNELGKTINLKYPFISYEEIPGDLKYIHILAVDNNDNNSEVLTLNTSDFKTVTLSNDNDIKPIKSDFDFKTFGLIQLGAFLLVSLIAFGIFKLIKKRKEKKAGLSLSKTLVDRRE